MRWGRGDKRKPMSAHVLLIGLCSLSDCRVIDDQKKRDRAPVGKVMCVDNDRSGRKVEMRYSGCVPFSAFDFPLFPPSLLSRRKENSPLVRLYYS